MQQEKNDIACINESSLNYQHSFQQNFAERMGCYIQSPKRHKLPTRILCKWQNCASKMRKDEDIPNQM